MRKKVQYQKESISKWITKIGAAGNKDTTFCYILNRDQSVRWLWPATASKPLFLKFYTISSIQSHVFSMLSRLVFFLKIQRLVFKTETVGIKNLPWNLNIDQTEDWALFTGTIGPNRKIVLTGKTIKGEASFLKIPVGETALGKVTNEGKNLETLKSLDLPIFFPKRIVSQHGLLQQTKLPSGKRSVTLTNAHFRYLKAVEEKTLQCNNLTAKDFITHTLANSSFQAAINDPRMPRGLYRKAKELAKEISSYKGIDTSFAHGDFTAWNSYLVGDKLAVYDWEMAQDKLPKGYDAFHYVIQTGVLIKRLSWTNIYKELKQTVLPVLFKNDTKKFDEYLNYYLLHILTTSAVVFANQDHWHTQIQWLFSLWNDALSHSMSQFKNARQLVLMDLFDHLNNKEYATLKFNCELPEDVSEYSDVDLCLHKDSANSLIQYLKAHPLVLRTSVKKLSFMTVLQITFNDGQHLSIDLLTSLKRKQWIFQNINDVIQSGQPNNFGVRMPSLIQESIFVNSFYILNNAAVPVAYANPFLNEELKIEAVKYPNNPTPKQTLLTILKGRKVNRGFRYVKNVILYLFDTIMNLLSNKGFIITFSGVDGAGKSTLIEIAKTRIEKQLRKPVVVLRHRPSILPIINALFVGKEKAQEQALQTMPHDGTNSSFLSSLLRFCYYYTDYLLGQFYVQLKYVQRGKVVIYDRYYYDFISDAKRSNIQLPSWIARFGLALVIKPELNFFLYADSKTILKRKQELNAEKIEELTQSYKQLFHGLNQKSKSEFLGIENINLDQSIDRIMRSVNIQLTS